MNNEKVGVSLTKIIEEGEKLANNIERGVKVVEERGTVDAFNRVCSKVEEFYNSIKDVKLSGTYRTRVINALSKIMPSLQKLSEFKRNVLDSSNDLNVGTQSPSPSM